MKNRCGVVLVVFSIALIGLLCAPCVAQPEKEYQLLRQAEGVIPSLLEAASIEDPAIRAYTRFICLEMIYDLNAPALHQKVEGEVERFFADLEAGSGILPAGRLNEWRTKLMTLLRRNDPRLARQVEAAYMSTSKAQFAVQLLAVPSKATTPPVSAYVPELSRRIAASPDKLKQTLIEADAVPDPLTRYQLLMSAVRLALAEKQYGRAIQIAQSARPFEPKDDVNNVDFILVKTIQKAALADKDFENAQLAAANVRSAAMRSEGIAELGQALVRANRRAEGMKLIRESMTLLEEQAVIEPVSVIFHPVFSAFVHDPKEGFEAARRVIPLINAVPQPSPDQMPGGRNYTKYADTVLMTLAVGVSYTFGWTSSNDPAVGEVLEKELEYGPWKILARIAIERNRRYPLPQIVQPRN